MISSTNQDKVILDQLYQFRGELTEWFATQDLPDERAWQRASRLIEFLTGQGIYITTNGGLVALKDLVE
ncbi:MAG: hypothetical protein Q8O55_09695 [Dehalococcoidales bacterium]|nr:hypothetical protein [Dehalococcoidales bacterium]